MKPAGVGCENATKSRLPEHFMSRTSEAIPFDLNFESTQILDTPIITVSVVVFTKSSSSIADSEHPTRLLYTLLHPSNNPIPTILPPPPCSTATIALYFPRLLQLFRRQRLRSQLHVHEIQEEFHLLKHRAIELVYRVKAEPRPFQNILGSRWQFPALWSVYSERVSFQILRMEFFVHCHVISERLVICIRHSGHCVDIKFSVPNLNTFGLTWQWRR